MTPPCGAKSKKVSTALFRLRRATAGDHKALAEFYLRFEPKGASLGLPPRQEPGRWLDTLSGYPNFVVLLKGRVVAHAVLCPQGEAGEVAVFVGREYRHRGLARRLLTELVAEARRLQLRRVWGLVEFDNLPLLRLARSLGFTRGGDPYEFTLDLAQEARLPAARSRAA